MSTYTQVCNANTKKEMIEQFNLLLKECVKKFGGTIEDHRKRQLQNVSYFAGYYNPTKRKNIFKWLETEHPIFGKEK
jgi:predicted membrane-bound dolichyl-phosphate-mannose-protein mannosyltransferase